MATLHPNKEEIPALERFQDDETARAPEPHGAVTTVGFIDAPELDNALLAPEVLPGTSAEVFYSTLPPEAVSAKAGEKEQGSVPHLVNSWKWKKEVFTALAFICVAALVIGLGIGLKKRSGNPSSSPPTVSPTTLPQSVNGSLTQRSFNDSSLAAIILANGDRHLYFQDSEGAIRRMIHTASANQWISDSEPIDISNARNLTPIAAAAQKQPDGSEPIELYYITEHSQLNVSRYDDGSWGPFEDLSNYTTAANTRHLSITSTVDTNSTKDLAANQTANQAILLYEDISGNVTALLKLARMCDGYGCPYPGYGVTPTAQYWIDVSRYNDSIDVSPIEHNRSTEAFGLYSSSTLNYLYPEGMLSTSFASGTDLAGIMQGFNVQMMFCNDSTDGSTIKSEPSHCNSMLPVFFESWNNASHSAVYGDAIPVDAQGHDANPSDIPNDGAYSGYYSGVKESDIALFGNTHFAIWINGTRPAFSNYNGAAFETSIVLNASFPYKRLSSATTPDQSASYLYHQINGTTFAEEQYVVSLNEWLPSSYITVPGP